MLRSGMGILPRDEKFYDLLSNQVRIAADASSCLVSLLGQNGGGRTTGAADQIRALEEKGDEALHDIYKRLHKSFITPIDPEDIHALASRVDEVLDHIEATAYRVEAFGLRPAPPKLAAIGQRVDRCVQALREAIEHLEKEGVKKPEEIDKRCEEINRLERESENEVRGAVRELFESEKDPIALLKQKELYEYLESTGDCCERAADVLQAISVKNT